MTAILLVDNRESSVMNELNLLGVPYETVQLEVGDFEIVHQGATFAVFERKTYKDLAASIKDSRYKEQKYRLLSVTARHVGYILEGSSTGFTGFAAGTLESVIAGSALRDRLKILPTNGTKGTALLLKKICDKIEEYVSAQDIELEHQKAQISQLQSNKGSNYTRQVCYLSQLSQLPQVSHSTATAIAELCPDMPSLVRTLLLPDGVNKIAKLSTGQKRIGLVTAQKIYEYMIGSSASNTDTNIVTETVAETETDAAKEKAKKEAVALLKPIIKLKKTV